MTSEDPGGRRNQPGLALRAARRVPKTPATRLDPLRRAVLARLGTRAAPVVPVSRPRPVAPARRRVQQVQPDPRAPARHTRNPPKTTASPLRSPWWQTGDRLELAPSLCCYELYSAPVREP